MADMKKPAPKITAKPKRPAIKPAPFPKPKPKPKAPAMPKKRPMVGTDKQAKKKYGDSSWNNGYTN